MLVMTEKIEINSLSTYRFSNTIRSVSSTTEKFFLHRGTKEKKSNNITITESMYYR